ncbi:MAG: MBL fold metallo-hydrolase [Lachnospiraceae bacterium]|nr:MBL fold metallo-hydrolase [Lachnospiraceae bacterium]
MVFIPTEIIKDIYAIDIPLVGSPLKNLNSYLIKGGSRNLLIDTGFRTKECKEAMMSQLEELQVSLSDTDIFLTHFHSDHTGLSTDLIQPGSKLMISAKDANMLGIYGRTLRWKERNERFLKDGFPPDLMEETWKQNPARSAVAEPYGDYVRLYEGDVMKYGDYVLKCIDTAGHTPGHMCLYHEESGTIFLGDHILFDITPNIVWWGEMEDALGTYLSNLDKLTALDITVPLPGHRHWAGISVYERIQQLKRHHTRRLEEICEILSVFPGLNAYEIAGDVSWKIRAKNWEAFPVSQKWFAVGEVMAHLDHLISGGFVRRLENETGKYLYYLN